jgi:hypothetical protein
VCRFRASSGVAALIPCRVWGQTSIGNHVVVSNKQRELMEFSRWSRGYGRVVRRGLWARNR